MEAGLGWGRGGGRAGGEVEAGLGWGRGGGRTGGEVEAELGERCPRSIGGSLLWMNSSGFIRSDWV